MCVAVVHTSFVYVKPRYTTYPQWTPFLCHICLAAVPTSLVYVWCAVMIHSILKTAWKFGLVSDCHLRIQANAHACRTICANDALTCLTPVYGLFSESGQTGHGLVKAAHAIGITALFLPAGLPLCRCTRHVFQSLGCLLEPSLWDM